MSQKMGFDSGIIIEFVTALHNAFKLTNASNLKRMQHFVMIYSAT